MVLIIGLNCTFIDGSRSIVPGLRSRQIPRAIHATGLLITSLLIVVRDVFFHLLLLQFLYWLVDHRGSSLGHPKLAPNRNNGRLGNRLDLGIGFLEAHIYDAGVIILILYNPSC